jgi:hypothetical protein
VQVSGQYPNNTATILNSTAVCNSIVHVVDQVLLPTASLATVPSPGNGLPGAAANASAAAGGSLFPGLTIGNKQTRASGRCQEAFLDAANQHNLTFLVQVCTTQAHRVLVYRVWARLRVFFSACSTSFHQAFGNAILFISCACR